MIREGDMDGDGFLNERGKTLQLILKIYASFRFFFKEFIAIMRPETKFIKVNI